MNDDLQLDWRAERARLLHEKLHAEDSPEVQRLVSQAEQLRDRMTEHLAQLRRQRARRPATDPGLVHIGPTVRAVLATINDDDAQEPGELIETPPIPASAVPYRPGDAVLIRHHGQDFACTIAQVYHGLQVALEVCVHGQRRPVFIDPHQVVAHLPVEESRP